MGADNTFIVTVDGKQVFADVTGPADAARLQQQAVGAAVRSET